MLPLNTKDEEGYTIDDAFIKAGGFGKYNHKFLACVFRQISVLCSFLLLSGLRIGRFSQLFVLLSPVIPDLLLYESGG